MWTSVEEVHVGKEVLSFWDIGGCDKIRPLIRHYMMPGHSILFLVDTAWCISSQEGLDYTLEELVYHCKEASSNGVLFIGIALAKQDLLSVSATEAGKRSQVLDLVKKLRGSVESIFPRGFKNQFDIYTNEERGGISAVAGNGFEDSWLAKELLNGIRCALGGKRSDAKEQKEDSDNRAETGLKVPITSPPRQDGTKPNPGLSADQLRALIEKQNGEDPDTDLEPVEFFRQMESGALERWDHRAHLRAGFYVLVEHLRAGHGLWDAAEDFLGKLENMLANDSKKAEEEKREKRFRNTVHR